MTGVDVITAILLAGIFTAVIVYLLYWLYQRSSKEVSFVRTGFGGEKVILSGGALVLPIVHNITRVGMKDPAPGGAACRLHGAHHERPHAGGGRS